MVRHRMSSILSKQTGVVSRSTVNIFPHAYAHNCREALINASDLPLDGLQSHPLSHHLSVIQDGVILLTHSR